MIDAQERELRAELQDCKDFLQRQQLLKALWKLQRCREKDEAKDDYVTSAA